MAVRFVLALLAVLSVEASLTDYLTILNLPPTCETCIANFDELLSTADSADDSEFQGTLSNLCSAFPHSIKSRTVGGWDTQCATEATVKSMSSGMEMCQHLKVCPTMCEYCMQKGFVDGLGYYAWDANTPENKESYCNAMLTRFEFGYGSCEANIALMTSGTKDDIAEFCTGGDIPFCDAENSEADADTIDEPEETKYKNFGQGFPNYIAQDCLDTPNTKECFSGHTSRSYEQSASADGVYVYTDPCEYEEVCVCDIGYALGAGGACTVADGNRGQTANPRGGFMEKQADLRKLRREHVSNRVQQSSQVAASIARAMKLQAQQTVRTREAFVCDGTTWSYFTDSPVDGITYTSVGIPSIHEYYAFALRQDLETVTMAINFNLPQEGQMMSATVTVSMGDWIMNPIGTDGTYKPLEYANNDNSLWGLHVDPSNDNPDALGVYSNAKFYSVANLNNGFNEVSAYIAEIDSFNSVVNNMAAMVKFGGGIDEEGGRGIHYLSETPFNNMVPGYSTFEGALSSDVEYYWTEDPEYYPSDAADLATLTDEYGLTWVPYEGLGIHHRIWHFPRILLPPEESWFRMHVAAECFNEVIAGEVMFCELPSKSSSPTRTPTRTPSRTPSVSPSRTATPSPSLTRTPSVSASATPAPSIPLITDDCSCLDYGQVPDEFRINTLSLGNFDGTSDTQGRLFVCGDADLRGYSVGDALPPSISRDDLVVSGDLTFLTGRVHAGNIVYGSDATVGNAVAHGMFNRTITQEANRFDCAGAESFYSMLSLNIGAADATGTTVLQDDGTFVFTRAGAQSEEIFELSCDLLPQVNKMAFRGIPMGQSVIVNWRGETCDVTQLNIVPTNPSKVLFNFPEATTVNIKTAAVEASILAPFADVVGNGGVVRGQVVAGSWTGSTQQNYMECMSCLNKFITGF